MLFTVTIVYDTVTPAIIIFVGKMLKLWYKLDQTQVPLLGMICGNGKTPHQSIAYKLGKCPLSQLLKCKIVTGCVH